MDKTEDEMVFVAENLVEGMFFVQDDNLRNIYKEGFQWIAASDNIEATQELVDSFVDMGIRYKDYGADKMAIQVLQQVKSAKSSGVLTHKDELVKIVDEGLVKLQ